VREKGGKTKDKKKIGVKREKSMQKGTIQLKRVHEE
jgi:hypothetical protein